jgi:signal transduction histidine kinase
VALTRIRDRLALPFILIAFLATAAAGLASLWFMSRSLTERVNEQITSGSALLARSDFALNRSILKSAAEVSAAHIVTFDANGILAQTTEDDGLAGLAEALATPDAIAELTAAGGQLVTRHVAWNGIDYYVAYRPVPAREGTYLAFASDMSRVSSAIRAARRIVIAIMIAGFIVLGLVSYFVVGRISRPIEAELVRAEKLGIAGLVAARVAHDVRNPLSSIKMQTQLLRSRLKGDADNQALLGAVLADINQVEIVIKGLLELARPGELRMLRTDINDVVRGVLRQVEPQMTHRKIPIQSDLAEGLPQALVDVERFSLALLNLVTNAADAMPSGGTLGVATARGADGSSIVVDVCDDGVGIDPKVAERLFDPFVSTKRDGIGLGLVNVKAVAESHGGSVALTPREPKGTRARITLPV